MTYLNHIPHNRAVNSTEIRDKNKAGREQTQADKRGELKVRANLIEIEGQQYRSSSKEHTLLVSTFSMRSKAIVFILSNNSNEVCCELAICERISAISVLWGKTSSFPWSYVCLKLFSSHFISYN